MKIQDWIRRLPITRKVALPPLFSIVGLVLIGGLALFANNQLVGGLTRLSDEVMPRALTAAKLAGRVAETNARVNQTLALEGSNAPVDKIAKLDEEIVKDLADIQARLDYIKKSVGSEEGKQATDDSRAQVEKALTAYDKYSDSVQSALNIKSGMGANAASFINVLETSYDDVRRSLETLAQNQSLLAQAAAADGNSQVKQNQIIIGLSMTVALLCAISLAYVVGRLIVRPLQTASTVALDIAQGGDLGHRIPDVPVVGDEIADMANSFNTMVGKVEESAKLVRKKSNDMAAMLKNMPQGLLTIDANNRIQPEYSAQLERILGSRNIAGNDVMSLVFSGCTLDSDALSQISAVAGACVGEDAMNFEFNNHILPAEVERHRDGGGYQVLDLTWSPIVSDDGTTDQILLCIRDVTELRELSREAAAQKRDLELIGQILAVPVDKFESMVSNAQDRLDQAESVVSGELTVQAVNEAFKHLHTIKGNARTYALKHLASSVHDAEQIFDVVRAQNDPAAVDVQTLCNQLVRVRTDLDLHVQISREKLGRKGASTGWSSVIDDKDVKDLQDRIERAINSQSMDVLRSVVFEAQRLLKLLKASTIEDVVQDLKLGMTDLANELGKPTPQVAISGGKIALEEKTAVAVRDAMMHIMRNSLDHGIEPPEERESAGKERFGRISISAARSASYVRITVFDDGRGLGIAKIRSAAISKNLEAMGGPDHELAELIFHPGFSTAKAVTLTSGRGVGMDAVRSALLGIGGNVQIEFTDSSEGATFRRFCIVLDIPVRHALS